MIDWSKDKVLQTVQLKAVKLQNKQQMLGMGNLPGVKQTLNLPTSKQPAQQPVIDRKKIENFLNGGRNAVQRGQTRRQSPLENTQGGQGSRFIENQKGSTGIY